MELDNLLLEEDAINLLNYCFKCEEVPDDAYQAEYKKHYPSRFKDEDINQMSTPERICRFVCRCIPRFKRDKTLDEYKLSALHISSRHFDVHSSNILLHYMLKATLTGTILADKFEDLFETMVEYPNFPRFLQSVMSL